MLLYNVTTKVSQIIADEWLQWIKEEHIPEMVATRCFTHASVLRLMEIDDEEGPTFAVQYFAESQADYDRYLQVFANALRHKSFEKWGNQFISFRSLMHIVQ